MKKIIAIAMVVLFLFVFSICLSACSDNSGNLESSSDVSSSDRIAISLGIATSEQLINTTDYIHFYDSENVSNNYNIVITVNGQIDDLKFLELDESENLKVGKTLYEIESAKIGESYIFHTYINDAMLNRGISYKDKNGRIKHYGIELHMDSGSIDLKEIDF